MKSSRVPSKAGSRTAPARAARGRGSAPAPGAGTGLLERLGRGDIPATLYVDGPCAPLVAALLAELRAAWAAAVPESPIGRILRTAESSVEEMLSVYQGASLFSSRELAIVLEVEDLGRSEKRVAALAAGLSIPAGGSTLVLVESEADEPRKSLEPLRAACAVHWTALPPAPAELVAWGSRRLRRLKLEAEPGVLERVAEACEGETL